MRGVIGVGDEPMTKRAPLSTRARAWKASISPRAFHTESEYAWGDPRASTHIVAYDFGIKRNILRLFEARAVA